MWIERKVTVPVVRDGKAGKKTVSGKVQGPLAIYAGLSDIPAGWFELKHLPSGIILIYLPGEADLMKIGDVLTNNCASALTQTEANQIKRRMSAWVEDWIQECFRQQKFVERVVADEASEG